MPTNPHQRPTRSSAPRHSSAPAPIGVHRRPSAVPFVVHSLASPRNRFFLPKTRGQNYNPSPHKNLRQSNPQKKLQKHTKTGKELVKTGKNLPKTCKNMTQSAKNMAKHLPNSVLSPHPSVLLHPLFPQPILRYTPRSCFPWLAVIPMVARVRAAR